MLKRLILALSFAGLLSPAYAAGTIPGFSLAQQQDSDGTPLIGCRLSVIQAGTISTPQTAYQDSALTIPLSNPVICDAFGRLPQIFLADGSIKLRLTKSNGVQVFADDGILVVGASSGGGGGSPVDATTILATGDIKARYGTGVLSGFVRANGRTIGSATSGATERANSDCETLFEYLWDTDANLTVSTGRGVSSAADFAANKTIALPDFRSRALAGLGDMGNSDNGLFSGATFTSGNSTTLGSLIGAARRTLLNANLPPYTPSGTVSTTSALNATAAAILQVPAQSGNTVAVGGASSGGSFAQPSPNVVPSSTFTGTAQGGTSTPFDIVSPYGLVTIYLKL